MSGTFFRALQSARLQKVILWTLLGFTVVSLAGYWMFALHPENLVKYPGALSFYSISFEFFAQIQVSLSFVALGLYLLGQVRLRWIGAFLLVYGVSFLSEFVGTTFGVPFGPYSYTHMLGIQWFDRVPILIPVSWFTMTIPSYLLARTAFPKQILLRTAFAAFLLTMWDLSLDPAMSHLTTYWIWGESGAYFGMPAVNLAGWYVTSLVLMALLPLAGIEKWADGLSLSWMTAYYGIVLLMPFGMSFAAGLTAAVAATAAAIAFAALVLHYTGHSGTTGNSIAKHAPAPEDRERNPEQPETPENSWAYFRHHSRSFSAASMLFGRYDRKRVSYLYSYCRLTDDLVDHAAGTDRQTFEALDKWEKLSRCAYDGKASGIAWLDVAMQDARNAGLPFSVVEALLQGVRSDISTVAVEDVGELDRYCYRVAGVVGQWMCYVFGVTDRRMLDRATALGKAMQLTNILRDVGEDYRNGRRYLPQSLMDEFEVDEEALQAMMNGAPVNDAYRALIKHMMHRADRLYDYAWEAIPRLPSGFQRAVVVSAALYQGIHDEIVANAYDNLTKRAFTSPGKKAVLAGKGMLRLRKTTRSAASSGSTEPAYFTTAAEPTTHDLTRDRI